MKSLLFSIASVLSMAGCAAEVNEQQVLMERIESAVVLPEGARPIEQYSRNYAFRPDGKVVAIYVRPWSPARKESDEYGCEVALPDFQSRPCTTEEINEMKQHDVAAAARFGSADESRWFAEYLELPFINDGGCDQIEIVFDPQIGKVESAKCNGFA